MGWSFHGTLGPDACGNATVKIFTQFSVCVLTAACACACAPGAGLVLTVKPMVAGVAEATPTIEYLDSALRGGYWERDGEYGYFFARNYRRLAGHAFDAVHVGVLVVTPARDGGYDRVDMRHEQRLISRSSARLVERMDITQEEENVVLVKIHAVERDDETRYVEIYRFDALGVVTRVN